MGSLYNYYDIKGALESFSTITWPQIDGAEKGDIVYCYVTNPYRAVLFKCEIDETGLNHMDDSAKEYVKHAMFYENKQSYMRLICREEYPENKYTDVILKENGVESLQVTSKVSMELSKFFHLGNQQQENAKGIKTNSGKGWKVLGLVILCAAIIAGGVWYQGEHKKSELYVNALQKVVAEQYEDAISIFEQIGDYKDSEEQIANCEEHIKENLYVQAIGLFDSKSYDEAITIFEELGDYKDSQEQIVSCNERIEATKKEETYDMAVGLMQAGEYDEAIVEFGKIPGYEDTAKLLQECEKLNRLVIDPNFNDKSDLAYYFGKTIDELMKDHSDIKLEKCVMRSKVTDEDIYQYDHKLYVFTLDSRISTICLYKSLTTSTSKYSLLGHTLGGSAESNDVSSGSKYSAIWYSQDNIVDIIVASAMRTVPEDTEFSYDEYYISQFELGMVLGYSKNKFMKICPEFAYNCTIDGIDIYKYKSDLVGIDTSEDVVCWTHCGGSEDYCNKGYYMGMSETKADQSTRFSMTAGSSSWTCNKDGIVISADGFYKEYYDVIDAIIEDLEKKGLL